MNQFRYKELYGRNLPHIQPPGAILFVTFRLAGSIPRPIMEEWLQEKKLLTEKPEVSAAGSVPGVGERLDSQRRWFRKFESALHSNTTGPTWLKDECVAGIVQEALHHRDRKVYRLDAFCIMPNHVHMVFAPSLSEAEARELAERDRSRPNDSGERTQPNRLRYRFSDGHNSLVLSTIMQSLKGYTARKCNLVLHRSGAFWQHESFDRVIRDEEEFDRTVRYVLNNPVKSGMAANWREWNWNYCRPDLIDALGL